MIFSMSTPWAGSASRRGPPNTPRSGRPKSAAWPRNRSWSLARAYGRARAPFIRTGWGPARQLGGGMAMRAIALLPALINAFAKEGGGILRGSGTSDVLNTSRLSRPDLCPPDARTINMVELGDALTKLDDPPVKLLYVYLSNPAVVAPDSGKVLAGLAREDLFVAVHEMFLTETARYADVVLPGASCLEMTDLYASYGHRHLQMARPVIPPVGQSRSILDVFQDLAARFGFGEDVFQADVEAIIGWLLNSGHPALADVDMERFWACRPVRVNLPDNPYAAGFNTPSGKVEFFSQAMADLGLDPLPSGEPVLDEGGLARFPLRLITPPRKQFLNTTFNEVDSLVAEAGPADVMLHPDEARARGLADGQMVTLSSARGSCQRKLTVTERARPGVAVAEGIYWGSHAPDGKGINQLTSQRLADLGGSCAFHSSLVEIS